MKFKTIAISDTLTVRELDLTELTQAYPVISQLRTHLSLAEYLALAGEMKANAYQVLCLFEGEQIVAYAGFARGVNLYYGRHVWVYDLVTDQAKRGRGYGRVLLSYVEDLARDNSLECIALSSRFIMKDAHWFYENAMNYDKIGYVFKKDLQGTQN